MTTTALVEWVTEGDPLRRCRLDELVRAGYSPTDALVLSGRADVDVRVAMRLLRNGCPAATALRILI